MLALGIKDAIQETTGKVAGVDFYLIGFDNIEDICNFQEKPYLSTVDNCFEKVGQNAARLLLDSLMNKNTQDFIEYESIYIERKSFPKLKNNI